MNQALIALLQWEYNNGLITGRQMAYWYMVLRD